MPKSKITTVRGNVRSLLDDKKLNRVKLIKAFTDLDEQIRDLQNELAEATGIGNETLLKELRNPSNWNGNQWRPALAADSDILQYLDKVFQ
jgi:hypothetical protein